MKPELVSQRIRLAVREEFVGWTLAQIGDLFTAEGFSPDLSYSPQVGGERRSYVEQFYARIDWADWEAWHRYLRVVEAVLDELRDRQIRDPQYAGTRQLIPVVHGTTYEEVRKVSPLLGSGHGGGLDGSDCYQDRRTGPRLGVEPASCAGRSRNS